MSTPTDKAKRPRARKYPSIPEQVMAAIYDGRLPVRQAAALLKIPRTTLYERLRGQRRKPPLLSPSKPGYYSTIGKMRRGKRQGRTARREA